MIIRLEILGTERQSTYVEMATKAIRRHYTREQGNQFSIEARFLSTTLVKQKAWDEYRIKFIDSLESVKKEAIALIDQAAIDADHRLEYIGDATYIARIMDVDAWEAAGSPANISGNSWGFMRAEGKRLELIYGQTPTAQQVANSIRSFQVTWEAQAEKREKYRGVGRAYIQIATDYDQVIAARDKALYLLGTLDK